MNDNANRKPNRFRLPALLALGAVGAGLALAASGALAAAGALGVVAVAALLVWGIVSERRARGALERNQGEALETGRRRRTATREDGRTIEAG